MDYKLAGAFAFGLIIGWYVYYVNRYRKADVQMSDITTIIGAIGGGAVLALFDRSSDLFGAYGIGLAVGFFLYFLTLMILVGISKNFDADWFLDGRRRDPQPGVGYGQDVAPTIHPMALQPAFGPVAPAATQQTFYVGTAPAETPVPPFVPRAFAPLAPPAAALDPKAQRVIDTCAAAWPAKKNACNFFAIEVAKNLGVSLTGTADDIVHQIRSATWTKVADGPAAKQAAEQGRFVVAALKSKDFTHPRTEGHAAVVVAGAMNPGGWAPSGYWGSTDSDVAEKGGNGSPISWCFRLEDKDKIVYASRSF